MTPKHDSTLAHQRLEMIAQLESQQFIFAQDPKPITDALKFDTTPAYDRLFIRAEKIDSNHKLLDALTTTQDAIGASVRLIYGVYFVLGLLGVAGVLGAGVVNFFYIIIALLGWHTLSILWWFVGLIRPKNSLFERAIERITIHNPIYKHLTHDNDSVHKAALAVMIKTIAPVRRWYLSARLHGAWLAGLFGSLLGLLGLFLFRRYGFGFESTLLDDTHFYQLLGVIGYIPAKLGLTLPTATDSTPAQFAYLVMACIVLYGIVPRALAYAFCQARAKLSFTIDTGAPYYAKLLDQFRQSVIDTDDYQASPILDTQPIQYPRHTALIKAALERADSANQMTAQCLQDIGVIDSKDEILAAVALCNRKQTQLYLGIDTSTPPDRGILRKIKLLQAIDLGFIVRFIGKDTHLTAWQAVMQENGILVIDE